MTVLDSARLGALFASEPRKKAFHQACAAIGDEPDSAMPQLFFRRGIDSHKIVLVRPDGDDGP